MKQGLFSLVALATLVGCSSATTPLNQNSQITEHSSGQILGDATSLYWYTEKLSSPITASDYVMSGDYGWYKSQYDWDGAQIQQIKRKGEQLNSKGKLVDFDLELRFSSVGEAVYQRYRRDGKVTPMKEEQISQLQKEAGALVESTNSQSDRGFELIQGYWDGEEFITCNGNKYDSLSFNQTLPSFVINRLAAFDSYIAFSGKLKIKSVEVDDLLLLEATNYDCVEKPVFR